MTHISEGSVRDDLHREMSNRLSMSQIQFDISCSGRSLFNLVRSCFASSYACLDSDQYRTRLERNGSCTHLRLDTSDTTSRSSSDQIQLRDEPKHLLEKKVVSLHVVVERENGIVRSPLTHSSNQGAFTNSASFDLGTSTAWKSAGPA